MTYENVGGFLKLKKKYEIKKNPILGNHPPSGAADRHGRFQSDSRKSAENFGKLPIKKIDSKKN